MYTGIRSSVFQVGPTVNFITRIQKVKSMTLSAAGTVSSSGNK